MCTIVTLGSFNLLPFQIFKPQNMAVQIRYPICRSDIHMKNTNFPEMLQLHRKLLNKKLVLGSSACTVFKKQQQIPNYKKNGK